MLLVLRIVILCFCCPPPCGDWLGRSAVSASGRPVIVWVSSFASPSIRSVAVRDPAKSPILSHRLNFRISDQLLRKSDVDRFLAHVFRHI